jgi:hypothetical protein
MALHNTIAMILITRNHKGCLAFLFFFIVTILQYLKMDNAIHALRAMQQIQEGNN